jgi:hypothetical protein
MFIFPPPQVSLRKSRVVGNKLVVKASSTSQPAQFESDEVEEGREDPSLGREEGREGPSFMVVLANSINEVVTSSRRIPHLYSRKLCLRKWWL